MKGFGAGGMQGLMRQANQMQARMKKAQEELAKMGEVDFNPGLIAKFLGMFKKKPASA